MTWYKMKWYMKWFWPFFSVKFQSRKSTPKHRAWQGTQLLEKAMTAFTISRLTFSTIEVLCRGWVFENWTMLKHPHGTYHSFSTKFGNTILEIWMSLTIQISVSLYTGNLSGHQTVCPAHTAKTACMWPGVPTLQSNGPGTGSCWP
jgi:hypothetical protein